MAWEYYQFIDVESTALAEMIKRACFRKRKQLTIENDDKGLEYLNEVSQTLQDDRARAEYDALQQHGEEISQLYNDAVHAMESGCWNVAIQSFKRMLVLVPNQPSVSNQLGICFAEAWMFAEAQATFTKLLEISPDIAKYWANYATVLLKLSVFTPNDLHYGSIVTTCPYCGHLDSLQTGKGVVITSCSNCIQQFLTNTDGYKLQVIEQARKALQEAIRLEEYNAAYYIAMANTYVETNNFAEAEQWIERIIGRSNAEDYHDLEALFQLCDIYCQSRQLQKITQTAQRILAALPDDQDAREYAGHRFAQWAYQMYRLDGFAIAVTLVDAALIFLPQADKIQELAVTLRTCHVAYEELTVVKNISKIHVAQKNLLSLFLLMSSVTDADDYLQYGKAVDVQSDPHKRYTDPRVIMAARNAACISRLAKFGHLGNQKVVVTAMAEWLQTQSATNLKPVTTVLEQKFPSLSKFVLPFYQHLGPCIPKKRLRLQNPISGIARMLQFNTGKKSFHFGYIILAIIIIRALIAIFSQDH